VAFFAVFVILNDYRSRMNQLLFGFCTSMFLWMLGTFMMFAFRGDSGAAIFWDRFVYIGVVFMPSFMHHFSLVFTDGPVMKRQKILLAINYFLSFVFLAISRSPYFVDGLYYYSWGVHTQARILHTVFLGYFFIGTGIFFANVWRNYKKLTERALRMQSIYVFIAFALVIFIGGSAYLLAYNIDTHFPYSYVTGLIFPIMLFYAVSRHHLFGVKVISAEIFAGMIFFLGVMQIFLAQNNLDIILRVILALINAFFGVLLVQSMRREVAQRDDLAELAHNLEKANIRLQELDKQKTEFLSIASHQLRTPLSATRGFIELIEDGAYGKVGRKVVGALQDIDTNNNRLIKLVDEFLDISRIEQGRTKFTFAPADINTTITSVAQELHEKAIEFGSKIIWHKDSKLSKVTVDEEKIRHVVMNFIDNAIKYGDKTDITVTAKIEEKGMTVRVRDHGLGFGKKDEASFFQKFYRGENVSGVNVNGTGLGLYVCRRFIEAHGGNVWAHSAGLGKGSEFGFWVPMKQNVNAGK